jgi:hypothetical protein
VNIQDFEITAIQVDRLAALVTIELRAPEGSRHVLTLSGVKAFRVEDLVMQNEVGQILRSSGGRIDSTEIRHWIIWVTSMSDARSWLYEDMRTQWVQLCLSDALELVVLLPSAGAQIAAVCGRVTFT